MTPLQLAPNPVEHFYRGGPRIAELRGTPLTSDRQPEEWVAATVARFGEEYVGLARVGDGRYLRDLVAADPAGWLGPRAGAASRAGDADTGLLVKLLDAGQRLPVHAHPDRAFAARHLGCPYGKTEAWYVVAAEPDATVHLGWRTDVDAEELAARRDRQDSAWMLARMHRLPVRAGDAVLVPAGQVHAIGEGVLVIEAQEPTDFSVLLEWSVTTSTREESHLGLGFDLAMAAVSHRALGDRQLAALCRHVPGDRTGPAPIRCLPAEADPFFTLDVVAPDGAPCAVPAGFAALVVLDGSGELASPRGRVSVQRGDLLAVPHGFGDWHAHGRLRMVLARPGVDRPQALPGEASS